MKLIDSEHITFSRIPHADMSLISEQALIVNMDMEDEDTLILHLKDSEGNMGVAKVDAKNQEGQTILNSILLSEKTNDISLEQLQEMVIENL